MTEVWVAETWSAHGEDSDVQGVYDSREAAFEGLKDEPNMTVYVDEHGQVRGRPVNDSRPILKFDALGNLKYPHEPVKWAVAYPMEVKGRKGRKT